jgi:hypothetical protein
VYNLDNKSDKIQIAPIIQSTVYEIMLFAASAKHIAAIIGNTKNLTIKYFNSILLCLLSVIFVSDYILPFLSVVLQQRLHVVAHVKTVAYRPCIRVHNGTMELFFNLNDFEIFRRIFLDICLKHFAG